MVMHGYLRMVKVLGATILSAEFICIVLNYNIFPYCNIHH